MKQFDVKNDLYPTFQIKNHEGNIFELTINNNEKAVLLFTKELQEKEQSKEIFDVHDFIFSRLLKKDSYTKFKTIEMSFQVKDEIATYVMATALGKDEDELKTEIEKAKSAQGKTPSEQ